MYFITIEENDYKINGYQLQKAPYARGENTARVTLQNVVASQLS